MTPLSVITKRLDMLGTNGHFGDHKHITGQIFEMRIHTGAGYRLYAVSYTPLTLPTKRIV
ncbi:type II toxin-antitoxin system RelE/ParE family toxin [Helicobacter ailurogastricus]|uniref:hypothetical protein n=1 Tax=Helicobacter ailurogastricus TaxID=1578720 RepID=UPI000CF18DBE|nr:hypothetical protein [Helicobacter ailurogastricus]